MKAFKPYLAYYEAIRHNPDKVGHRPLEPQDIPVGALFRPYGPNGKVYKVTKVVKNHSKLGPAMETTYRGNKFERYHFLDDAFTCSADSQISFDNGKTWQLCMKPLLTTNII